MGSYNPFTIENPFKVTEKLPPQEYVIKYSPKFYLISLSAFESSVVPIISSKPEEKDLKIYDDKRIPEDIRQGLRKMEENTKGRIPFLSFITIWLSSKIPVNIIREKHLFAGISIFDKHVLAIAIPLGLLTYPYVCKLYKHIDLIDVQELMFTDRKNPALGLYRKRLVEAYPDYAGLNYRKDSELKKLDNVTIFDEKVPEPEVIETELTPTELEYLAKMDAENK